MSRSQSANIHGGLLASRVVLMSWKDAGLRIKAL